MKTFITRCRNCEHCIKSKGIGGMKYYCNLHDKKVSGTYYCGKVPPIQADIDLPTYKRTLDKAS